MKTFDPAEGNAGDNNETHPDNRPGSSTAIQTDGRWSGPLRWQEFEGGQR